MGESPTRRDVGRRSRAPTIIAPASCSAPTATTTRAWSTGSSRRRGSCTSSTPGNTRRARASGTAGSSATGSTSSRTRMLPDGQNVFDFGDIWAGAADAREAGRRITHASIRPARSRATSTCSTAWPRGSRTPRRRRWPQRLAGFGHTNREEWWTLLWRDAALAPAPMSALPLTHHFDDSGVVYHRTSWNADATAVAFKAGPPEGHRATTLLATVPEWRLEQRARASRRRQLHHLGARTLPHRRHRLRGPAAGAPPQHDHGRRPGPGRRGRARRLGDDGPGRARHGADHVGAGDANGTARRGRCDRRLPAVGRADSLLPHVRRDRRRPVLGDRRHRDPHAEDHRVVPARRRADRAARRPATCLAAEPSPLSVTVSGPEGSRITTRGDRPHGARQARGDHRRDRRRIAATT